ncbi:lyase [Colwelliaceae bacterium BS250]
MMSQVYLRTLLFCLLTFHSKTFAESNSVIIDIKEWQVPWTDSRPRDPAIDSQGNVWFCGQAGNYIARLNPETAKFKRFTLPDNTHPHNLIIDSKDNIWYAGNRNNSIGRLNPITADIEQIDMPGDKPIDPHTLVFNAEQNIWFTAQWGNKVGFLNTKTLKVKLIDMPILSARPYGIKVDYDDVPWSVLFGSNKLARVDPQTFKVTMVDLVDTEERPRRLEISQNNDIYYLDHQLGYVGKYQPAKNKLQRWHVPEGKNAKLYGSAIDQNDRLWLALTGVKPNKITVFDTNTHTFIASEAIPSGAKSIRYMYYHQQTDSVWFGTDANTIGRAKLTIKP